ncbi:MAG: translation initiation factor IF-2 N-terminal domain-containing protein, partial [Nitrospinales bacterium]
MVSIRINKIALELNVQNDQVIEELKKKNIPVKNYMSSIDEDAAKYIREIFSEQVKPKSKTAATKKAAATKAKTAAKKKAVKKKAATPAKKAAAPKAKAATKKS